MAPDGRDSENRLAEAIGALRAGAYIEKDGTPRRFPHDNRISIALGTRRVVPSRHSMGDGSWSVTFENVEVVRRGDLLLMCRVGQKIVGVPLRRMLSGTTILTVDRGQLVLARELALNLGLI